jgi:tRNA threonylcarbamoyladenosine dehydratase
MRLPLAPPSSCDEAHSPSESPGCAHPESRPTTETDANDVETPLRTHRRFDRAARLFSEPGLHGLMRCRVVVVGVGGVGSFAAEALARSGVGELVLVDFDKVCVTNTNRQLHTMKGTVGRHKVDVMAERLRLVHPTAEITPVREFYSKENSDRLLEGSVDYVVDAIDNITAKAHLIATCRRRGIPVVSSMGAAARLDPTCIRVDDLSNTIKDPFARALRRVLIDKYELVVKKGSPLGVDAVFSIEEPRRPSELDYDKGEGFRCVCPSGKNGKHECDRRARIDGSAAFVTGSFGLTAASVVVRKLLDGNVVRSKSPAVSEETRLGAPYS